MLTESTGRTIVFLLAGILAVLLFGKEALLSAIPAALGLIAAFAVLWVIWVICSGVAGSLFEEYRTEVESAGSIGVWRYWLVVAYAGFVGHIAVMICAGTLAILRWSTKNVISDIPYFWVPLVVAFSSYGMFLLGKRIRSRRKVEIATDDGPRTPARRP